jgi:molybdopterin-containing oxidoreductase family membrane subunit
MKKSEEQVQKDLLRPLFESSAGYWFAVAAAASLVLAGVFALLYGFYNGIGVWGLNSPVFWAFDITNFVFWIGISHAGTLISAILRLANATWRRPVTRCAEAITVFALSIGAIIPVFHIGRPWLAFWMFPYPSERGIWPNFRSPLAWDFFAINTYLIGSISFLFLPMIPGCGRRYMAHFRWDGRGRRGSGIAWKRRCTSWPSPLFRWPCRCTRSSRGISP